MAPAYTSPTTHMWRAVIGLNLDPNAAKCHNEEGRVVPC